MYKNFVEVFSVTLTHNNEGLKVLGHNLPRATQIHMYTYISNFLYIKNANTCFTIRSRIIPSST